MGTRRIVVGWSGGITSAWCGGWALRNFPPGEVVFLFHDTREEDEDTYRFSWEMSAALGHPITERSDGRSVTELAYDEHAIPNDRMAFCSRILKQEQRDRYFAELRSEGVSDITLLVGYTAREYRRIQLASAKASGAGYQVRFPLVEEKVTKQQVACWVVSLGVTPPRMYQWSDHANCVGCVRGGKQYWYRVLQHRPDVYKERAALEREFGHTIIAELSLDRLRYEGVDLRRRKESINVGSCECGD
jgi:hypothetical protein